MVLSTSTPETFRTPHRVVRSLMGITTTVIGRDVGLRVHSRSGAGERW
jgi:hypothetical protein